MTLAIFDLDNTLLAGDSDHLWGEFLVENHYVNITEYKQQNDQFYEDYQSGNLDIIAYQEFALKPLTYFSIEQLSKMHEAFIASKIQTILLKKAYTLIEQHREQGHTLLIITATNRFITEPIAKLLGINHLIATEGEIHNGSYTGKVTGIPSFGQGKITRLKQWLQNRKETLEGSYFYSDSHNDLPLLELVSHPLAVDPDPTLKAIAESKQWPIISLRG